MFTPIRLWTIIVLYLLKHSLLYCDSVVSVCSCIITGSSSPLPPSSSSSSILPPPYVSPVRPLRAPQRGHGGLSQRHEDLLGAGDSTAGPVRLQPREDVRQRPVAAVEVVRMCRYRPDRSIPAAVLGGAPNNARRCLWSC